jgi:hypothetical protein
MQKTMKNESENRKYTGLAFHLLRTVSIPESFLFFIDTDHYSGKVATSLTNFQKEFENVPIESIKFHFKRNDFQKWIRDTIGDIELASRIDNIKRDIQGNELRKTIQNIVNERVDELKREMWLIQYKATKLERTNFFKQRIVFEIDLSKIEGEGEFMCPECKEILSPEDPIDATFLVLDFVTSKDDVIEEALIECKKCKSMIRLHGFEMLS